MVKKRLTKIYTRRGDKGTTGMADGSRVSKDDARVEAIGAVDELNSCIGLLCSELSDQDPLKALFSQIQHQLFNLGGELTMPEHAMIQPEHIEKLENELDHYNEALPPLKEFILPGGNRPASVCHLARSVCRRAERRLVSLASQTETRQECQGYLNRLSDLLFVAARVLARRDGGQEVFWQHD